jgi:hypothetical protein
LDLAVRAFLKADKQQIIRPQPLPFPVIRSDRVAAVHAVDHPVATVAMALLCTGLPVLAHAVSPIVAIVLCLLNAGLVWAIAPAAIPIVVVTAFLFQNTFVAMVIHANIDKADFNLLRAYNFFLLATLFALACTWIAVNWRYIDATQRRFIAACSAALVIIAVYFLVGLQKDPSSASVYLRNMASGPLCFAVGMVAAWRSPGRTLGTYNAALPLIVIATLVYGYAELAFDFGFLELFGGDTYLKIRIQDMANAGFWVKKLQETGEVLRDPIDMYRTVLLNSAVFKDLGLLLYRPNGPNFHPISFAYALGFLSLCSLVKSRFSVALCTLPLLIIVGSKGALVLVVLSVLGLALIRASRASSIPPFVGAFLAVYMALAFIIGFRIGDYHVLGFMGGIHGFFANPFGRGLGVGGNISLDMAQIDWSAAQHRGRTDIAVESAVGVMLYQLGFGAIAVIGFNLWIARRCWHSFRQHMAPALALSAIAIVATTANGILQEEALFSPLAIGLTMLYAGLVLGEFRTSTTKRHR